MQRRKAINFIFPRGEARPRGNVYRPRAFDRVFEHFPFILGKNPPAGIASKQTLQRCKLNLLAQSCTFWIRGKRPFKPLSKLPSLPSFSLPSFFPSDQCANMSGLERGFQNFKCFLFLSFKYFLIFHTIFYREHFFL